MLSTPRTHLAILCSIVLLGVVLRVLPAASHPIWIDEASTWAASVLKPWSDFPAWRHHYTHPPLSYVLVKLSTTVFGSDAPWALRLPAMLAGILAIPAAYWLGRTAVDRTTGLWVAALIAADPNMVDQSQQARMYSLLMLFMLLAMTVFIRALRRPAAGLGHWLLLGLLLACLLNSSLLGMVVLGGLTVTVLIYVAAGLVKPSVAPHPWRAFGGMAVSVGIGLASILPMLLRKLGGSAAAATDELLSKPASPSAVAWVREIAVAAKDLINLTPAGLLVYLLAAAGLLLLWRRCRTSALIVMAVAAINVLSLFGLRTKHRFIDPRYLTSLQPALWLGLAMLAVTFSHASSADAVQRSTRALPAFLSKLLPGVLVMFIALQTWQCLNLQQWWMQPDRYLISPQLQFVKAHAAASDAVATHPSVLRWMARYYRLPVDETLEQAAWDGTQLRDAPSWPTSFEPDATWLVVGMVNYDGRIDLARRHIDWIAGHYQLQGYEAALAPHLALERTAAVRFSQQGMQMRSLGVESDAAMVTEWAPATSNDGSQAR